MGSWDTSTGLIDRLVLSFDEVWFGASDQYSERAGGNRVLLNVRGEASDPETGEVIDPEYHLMLSLGDKWETGDGGLTVAHSGGATQFNRASGLGRIINGLEKLLPKAELEAIGETYEASTWKGFVLDLERQVTMKIRDEDVEQWVPIAIIAGPGMPDTKAKAKPKAKPKPKPKGAAALRRQLIKFASDFDDHDDFVEAIEDFDKFAALEGNDDLYADALDPDGEVWAEAQA